MALLDFLKKKEEQEKAQKGKPSSAKASEGKAGKKSEEISVKKEAKAPKALKVSKGFSFEIISEPHISEKASVLSEKDQYIFEVLKNSNKTEIKKAVEGIYGVDVLSVNLVRIPPKKRRLGRTEGFRKGYKKAIVKIKNGQKIEII